MEFRDLQRQYVKLKEDINKEIFEVLSASCYINGPQVSEIEKELAEYVGIKHCISCANGTDALSLAMMAWDIGPGDAVFVPDFTFFSSGEIVAHAGATPIFVDVDLATFNVSIDSLETMIEYVTNNTKLKPKAIITVDLFGLPADYEKIISIANNQGLLILEDGAQGFGGSIDGKMACSFGDISTTSFFPSKPLGCYGDGGAVFTDNDEWADVISSIKVHGKGNDKYDNIRIGLNSRMDTIQAAILKIKMKAFKEYELAAINTVAEQYTNLLTDYVITPAIQRGFISSWAQYTIRCESYEKRDNLIRAFDLHSIPTSIFYRKPMHKQKAFESMFKYDSHYYPNSIELADTVLSLPIHPYMSEDEIVKVSEIIRKEQI